MAGLAKPESAWRGQLTSLQLIDALLQTHIPAVPPSHKHHAHTPTRPPRTAASSTAPSPCLPAAPRGVKPGPISGGEERREKRRRPHVTGEGPALLPASHAAEPLCYFARALHLLLR